MLTKQTVIDKVEVIENGTIQVRRATYILEDGVRIAGPMYHRMAYAPGADIATEDEKVQAITNAVWTPAVIAAYLATKDVS